MTTGELEHLRYKLGGVLPALLRATKGLSQPPPAVLASCIVLGHTRREDVEQVLGVPWRPQGGSARKVAHYTYPPNSHAPDALGSLFIEYDDRGIVRAISASTSSMETPTANQ